MPKYPAIIKPMKGEHYVPELLKFPCVLSAKLDGIRCHGVANLPLSNTNKLIPNLFIQSKLSMQEFTGFDGELIVGNPNLPETYNNSLSGVMTIKGEPNFNFFMFDTWDNCDIPFIERYDLFYGRAKVVNQILENSGSQNRVIVLRQKLIHSLEELDFEEDKIITAGYEGVMLRAPEGLYKFGRSTVNQGWLLKVKQFVDDEATIIDGEELMHNDNESFTNELGHSARSTNAEGLSKSGILGAYWCTSPKWKDPFKVSCGSMKKDERAARFASLTQDKGKQITFKHFPKGAKDKPRHGIFKGFRHPDDVTDY